MSDFAATMSPATLQTLTPVALDARAAKAPSNEPLAFWPTALWGAAAMLAMFSTAIWIEWLEWTGTTVHVSPPVGMFMQPMAHMMALGMVVVALLLAGRRVRGYLALSRPRVSDVLRGIGYGIAGFVGMALMFAWINMIQSALAGHPVTGTPMTFSKPTALALIALWSMMVLAAPLVEEVLFRGFLYRGLAATRLGTVGTILLTSVVFGLSHKFGFGWDRVFVTGCVGVLLGWLRWRMDNTCVSMVAHASLNTCGAATMTALMFAAA